MAASYAATGPSPLTFLINKFTARVCAPGPPSPPLSRCPLTVFRDRRPDLYGALLTLDGRTRHAAYGPP